MNLNSFFTKVDFSLYENAYDKDVIQEWKAQKRMLDVENLRALMFGFTYTKEYAEGNLEDSLFMDYWRDRSYELDIELDPKTGKDKPAQNDFDLMHEDDYFVDTPQERLLMQTIDSTGDGKTPETALCVIDIHQEYEYIERKFPFFILKKVKQSVSKGIDCLYFEENPYGIQCLYFDVKRRFEVGYHIPSAIK